MIFLETRYTLTPAGGWSPFSIICAFSSLSGSYIHRFSALTRRQSSRFAYLPYFFPLLSSFSQSRNPLYPAPQLLLLAIQLRHELMSHKNLASSASLMRRIQSPLVTAITYLFAGVSSMVHFRQWHPGDYTFFIEIYRIVQIIPAISDFLSAD